jgi:hypothetical protein
VFGVFNSVLGAVVPNSRIEFDDDWEEKSDIAATGSRMLRCVAAQHRLQGPALPQQPPYLSVGPCWTVAQTKQQSRAVSWVSGDCICHACRRGQVALKTMIAGKHSVLAPFCSRDLVAAHLSISQASQHTQPAALTRSCHTTNALYT